MTNTSCKSNTCLAISVLMVTLVVVSTEQQQQKLPPPIGKAISEVSTETLPRVEDHVYVKDAKMKNKTYKDFYFVSETKALKIVRKKGDILKRCDILERKDADKDTLLNMVVVTEDEMDEFIRLCLQAQKHHKYNIDDAISLKKKRSLIDMIYPGTKWCGMGNISANYDDLGESVAADTCCRAHDNCSPSIEALSSGYGLDNFALWTKLHCNCDSTFFYCLKNAHTLTANGVGVMFFNTLDIGCFDYINTYAKTCNKRFWGICYSWVTDYSRPVMAWAFVDNEYTY